MKVTVIGFALLALVAVLVGGWYAHLKRVDDFSTAIHRVAKAALVSGRSEVNVATATDFEWDHIFIFGPYTPIQRINTQLGHEWPEIAATGIHLSETFSLWVFEKKGLVVRYFKIPRTIDFEGIMPNNGFSYGEAVFSVKRSDDGPAETRLILSPRG